MGSFSLVICCFMWLQGAGWWFWACGGFGLVCGGFWFGLWCDSGVSFLVFVGCWFWALSLLFWVLFGWLVVFLSFVL